MADWTRAFSLQARAKLNLRLDIGDIEAGGLHALRSLAASLSLADELVFTPSEGRFSVRCAGAAIPETENLAWRAGSVCGVDLDGVRVEIMKNIPLAAGLGGGSADAAAALHGFARIALERGGALAPQHILRIARELGSDIPACLTVGFKIMEDSGGAVRPLGLRAPDWCVVLVKPEPGMSTRDAYRLLDEARARRDPHAAGLDGAAVERLAGAIAAADFGAARRLVRNDFDGVVDRALPAVADVRRRLTRAGAACVILCGSGSCLAALFETRGEAVQCAARFERRAGEWMSIEGFVDGG